MKKQQPAKVVRIYGKIIEQNSRKIPGLFDADMIHDLRVAFKKLRAFTRLLQLEKKTLKMPEGLKSVYRSCGAVRDWQLMLQKLQQHSAAIPSFVKGLKQDLFTAKELLVMHIEDAAIKKQLRELEQELPGSLQVITVKQFIQRKVAAIHILLLALEQEEELHAIRKALKDLVYVKKILSSDLSFNYPFNEWSNDKRLEDLTTILGELNDQCIALSIFSTDRINDAGAEERQLLQEIRQQWVDEKNLSQQNAMVQVMKLQRFFKTVPE